MWRVVRILAMLLLLEMGSGSYLEFPLIRLPKSKQGYKMQPIACKNESSLNKDAEYREICYQKDISYAIPFVNNNQNYLMSVDFTVPISWIKSPGCKIQGTNTKCKKIIQTFTQKVKNLKQKISAKIHKSKSKQSEQNENAIIQGSSEIIHGVIQKGQHIQFISKNSNRLNNFFQLIMLGMFIYGQRDILELQSTNFINATTISSNLDNLNDGAISMRFDEASQKSFLNQIFDHVKATEKTVTVYLGQNHTLTIGDMTAKYALNGYSSIVWIDMPDDQGLGKLAQMSDIGIEDPTEDTEGQSNETLPVIFTLSASYIGLPQYLITLVVKTYLSNQANCTVNNRTFYLQCSAVNSKKMEKIKQKNMFFGFSGNNIMIPLKKLVLQQANKGKKLTLNIKKTYNNRTILGQPIFKQKFILFDYSKNKIGIAPKRQQFDSLFINVVTLVRFLCFVFVLGCSFIICYLPCKKMLKSIKKKDFTFKKSGTQGKRLRQYSPLQQNPYDQLKGQIKNALNQSENI